MHKFITIAAALAVGTMWSLGPASAQTTTDPMEPSNTSPRNGMARAEARAPIR